MDIRNVSNPAAYGAEWATSGGARYQLVNAVGSTQLTMGVLPAGQTTWHNTPVVNPDRFGPLPCTSPREMIAIARKFLES